MEKNRVRNVISILGGLLFFYLVGAVISVRFFDMSFIDERNHITILGYDEDEQRFIFNEERTIYSKPK